MSFILNSLLFLHQRAAMSGSNLPDHLGNYPDNKNSYVVGIPVSPSTVYLDNPNGNCSTPIDLNNRKRSNTSFQITSVTVQGSRMSNDELDDSADDYDESHTDDISSDILDSSRITEPDGYLSDATNTNFEDLSPCGPLIITPFTGAISDSNMNVSLGINMSPPFPTMASNMMSSGVTMITSSTESPVSAQVPMMNTLPDNWQHRFKVVKIVNSDPFKRGRWLCMDFKDPPHAPDNNKNNTDMALPAIQVTPCSADNNNSPSGDTNTVTHVFGIPVNSSAFSSDAPVSEYNQPIYGIFVPHNNYSQSTTVSEITAIQSVRNQNENLVRSQSIERSALPLHVRENNLNNNNVEVNYQKLNGHDPDITVSPHATVVKPFNPVPRNIVPEKVISRNASQEGNESNAPAGGSTVAIDNKIEQAMDLVKSHLMFAVREEVEVLKEKITELLERISQLEHENDILRANATPETLKQLNQSQKFPGLSKQLTGAPHIQNQTPPS